MQNDTDIKIKELRKEYIVANVCGLLRTVASGMAAGLAVNSARNDLGGFAVLYALGAVYLLYKSKEMHEQAANATRQINQLRQNQKTR